MKLITIIITCGVVTITIIATLVAALETPASTGPPPTAKDTGAPLDSEMAVLTHRGLSPSLAMRALEAQDRLGKAKIASKAQAITGSTFAGIWFDPLTAQLHIGITPTTDQRPIKRMIAEAGLQTDVSITPVRSTWDALVNTQNEWNRRLARLLAKQEAMTGLDSQHNAVSITLSSSVPPQERALLERMAAIAKVNVLVSIVPPSELRIEPVAKKTCKEPFVKGEAYCEEAATSGIGILPTGRTVCTGGPMLVEGNETYLLTAGHCFGAGSPAGGEPIGIATTSEYPAGGGRQEIGKVGRWYENAERDVAEIKIKRPGPFTEPLPDPVPALIAEWGIAAPKTPHTVTGEEANVEGQSNCHEGQTSGEQCGVIGKLNVTSVGTEHLVEDSACGESGDSGGPFFMREKTTKNVLMQGTTVSANTTKKCSEGGKTTYYEPLKDLAGAAGFSILSTFAKQKLLTTTNEVRKPQLKNKGEPLSKKLYTSKSGGATFETVGGSKISCSSDTGKGEVSSTQTGTSTITLDGCEGFSVKCETSGAKEGEIVLSAKYSIVFINGSKDEVGTVFEFTEAAIECGTSCPKMVDEKLKLRGSAIALATPVNEVVTPPKVFTLGFSQSKGVQAPTEYENEKGEAVKVKIELEGSGSKTFSFEQAGISDTDELLLEEAAELEAP